MLLFYFVRKVFGTTETDFNNILVSVMRSPPLKNGARGIPYWELFASECVSLRPENFMNTMPQNPINCILPNFGSHMYLGS